MSFPIPFSRKLRTLPRVPDGRRVYAIGDVHGSADLLNRLIDKILVDSTQRDRQQSTLIVLGDFIDRGRESAEIVLGLYSQRESRNLIVLLGNHEAALIAAYRGDHRALEFWLKFGGLQTLQSFGVDIAAIDMARLHDVMGMLHQHVPFEIINWMETLPISYRAGDYLFVHAGIRPGVHLNRQRSADMLWIREEFLNSERNHGVVVVHGHSPTAQVDMRANRIGIDTGAYDSGILSAIGLEGEERWVIDTAGAA